MQQRAFINDVVVKLINATTRKVIIKMENPALILSDDDEYWRAHDKDDEEEYITWVDYLESSFTESLERREAAEMVIKKRGWNVDLFCFDGIYE